MAIYRLLSLQDFEPAKVALLGNVFEDVLKTLALVNRQDPLINMIARKLIELAQTGERDPHRLKELTMQAFNGKPPANSAA